MHETHKFSPMKFIFRPSAWSRICPICGAAILPGESHFVREIVPVQGFAEKYINFHACERCGKLQLSQMRALLMKGIFAEQQALEVI
jgi:uncharacterized protein with PIN domain